MNENSIHLWELFCQCRILFTVWCRRRKSWIAVHTHGIATTNLSIKFTLSYLAIYIPVFPQSVIYNHYFNLLYLIFCIDGTLNTTTVLPTKPTLNTTFSTTKSSNISRRTSTTVINPTRRPIQRVTGVIDTNTSSNHTDSVSLSAALLFGVIFLLVVFYLVGKRWIEGLRDSHRRGYTRISYLLNGIWDFLK